MKRRTAIRNVVLLSAGAALWEACQPESTTTYTNIPLTGSQEDMLAELAETIIPVTDFVGARDLKSSEFILVMANDCASPEDQKKFLDGMKQFDDACKAKTGESFLKSSVEQRATFLTAIESHEENKEFSAGVIDFYKIVKRMTIQSFTSSEQYLTQVRHYSLIPARFEACVPVDKA